MQHNINFMRGHDDRSLLTQQTLDALYSERSEVSTRGPVERIWLRQNSKLPPLIAKVALALSFTSRSSSWLSSL